MLSFRSLGAANGMALDWEEETNQTGKRAQSGQPGLVPSASVYHGRGPLECSICFERFTDPRGTRCGRITLPFSSCEKTNEIFSDDVFCAQCFIDYYEADEVENRPPNRCPACRANLCPLDECRTFQVSMRTGRPC
jgi:hypothetical protein